MAKRYSILLDEVPADLKAVSDRIALLTGALEKKQRTGGWGKTEDRDCDQLFDYWFHVEVLQKERARDDQFDTDPLALLNTAEKFNLAAPEQIASLREEFNSKVRRIVGNDLSPRQVAQLYKLMTTFNPAKP